MPENLRNTLDFLRDLRINNNKQWFDQNRKRYDSARGNFESFVADVIASFGTIEDLTGVTPKECIFRLNRDVRFSPDKSPYKTNLGAVIGQGGRKASGRSYYMQIEPDGHSFVAGGLHSPSSEELAKVRGSLAKDSENFKEIIHEKDFTRYFGTLRGDMLKTAPQGFPKDHPDIELLRFKQYLAMCPISDELIMAPDLTAHVVMLFKTLVPFVTYIHVALGG